MHLRRLGLALCLASAPAPSWAAPPVSFCSGWTLGQRLDYRSTRVQEKTIEGGPATRVASSLDLKLEVIQQDASGFRVAWTYGKTAVEENRGGGPLAPWTLSLYDGLRMELRTDPAGRVKSVANARHVKEFLVAARRRMVAELPGLGASEEERILLTRALHLLTQPERSANLPLPDAEFLLQLCGRSLELGKRQRFEVAPAARGGEPSGSFVSYVLREVDPEEIRATVEFRNEQSPAVREFLGAFSRIAAEALGTEEQRLEIREAGMIEFDLQAGWPARVSLERTVRFGKISTTTRIVFQVVPPPHDPT